VVILFVKYFSELIGLKSKIESAPFSWSSFLLAICLLCLSWLRVGPCPTGQFIILGKVALSISLRLCWYGTTALEVEAAGSEVEDLTVVSFGESEGVWKSMR
jgi:hypothetical protein